MNHDVFISYSRKDERLVGTIQEALSFQGLNCWRDADDIRFGDHWTEAIPRAMDSCQYILLCISKSFIKSEWCNREVQLALTSDRGKPESQPHILPLLIDVSAKEAFKQFELLRTINCRKFDGNPEQLAMTVAHLGTAPSTQSYTEWTASNNRIPLLDALLDHESSISESRRQEIGKHIVSIIPAVQAHRNEHIGRLKVRWKNPSIADRKDPAWVRVNPTHSTLGYRLTIGFKNKSCQYRFTDELKLGCFNCGYYAGAQFQKVEVADIMEQLRRGFCQGFAHSQKFDVVEFLSDGSFLNDWEMPDQAKERIFETVTRMPYVKRILVESTPEHIYSQKNEIPDLIAYISDDQVLEVGIGFETADDFVRKARINKGFLRVHFERAVEYLAELRKSSGRNIVAVAYILVKPAFLSVAESIEDAIQSIRYLSELSERLEIPIVPKLEPAAVADGTLLSFLHGTPTDAPHHYSPVNYWMILEIMIRVYADERCKKSGEFLRIGAREDMDDILKVPAVYRRDGRFDKFDFVLYDAVQSYNRHREIFKVLAVIRDTHPHGVERLMGPGSSLSRWEQDELNEGRVKKDAWMIKELMQDSVNREKMDQFSRDGIMKLDAKFLRATYQALDVLEGYHNPRKKAKIYKTIKTILESCDGVVGPKESREFEAIVIDCFQDVDSIMFNIRMVDVTVEADAFVRLFFEALNFESGRTHLLWSEVPMPRDH